MTIWLLIAFVRSFLKTYKSPLCLILVSCRAPIIVIHWSMFQHMTNGDGTVVHEYSMVPSIFVFSVVNQSLICLSFIAVAMNSRDRYEIIGLAEFHTLCRSVCLKKSIRNSSKLLKQCSTLAKQNGNSKLIY